jgi:small subunit ribosomal protein S20
MANHKSAVRKFRRDEKKRLINRMNKSKMKNKIKLLRKLVSGNDADGAKKLYPEVMSIIDKSVGKGTIAERTGSRYKSRTSLLLIKSGIQI